MSDIYNAGASIVPFAVANSMLRAALGPDVELPSDEYARVQLLSEGAARTLIQNALANNFDLAALEYGELARDFPLCLDWARIVVALLTLAAAKAGMSVRPYAFRLHYTKHSGIRHAINGFLLAGGRILWLEPQGLRVLTKPDDLKSYDRVRL